MMHSYKEKDGQSCFSGRRIVFAGDPIVRQMFFAFARELGLSKPFPGGKGSDIHLTVNDVRLDFYWDPYLNSTGFQHAVVVPEEDIKAALSVFGSGLWYAKNVLENPFESWRPAIERVVALGHVPESVPSDLIVILPIPDPDYPRLSPARKTIEPGIIGHMNAYLEGLWETKAANVSLPFRSMMLTAHPNDTHVDDGPHLVPAVTAAQAQVLMNLRCNDGLSKSFPFDHTCCFKYPVPNYLQFLFFASILVVSVLYHFKSQDQLYKSDIPSEAVLYSILVFGFVLVYAFFADRTHLFGKEGKYFSLEQFWLLVILTLLLGYFTSETADQDQPFLSRDQTDEWKGWMQIFILIYHYLGASKVEWIYNIIRVLVAMYLFMTGFGHTVFFYKKADYGLKRVVPVLLRLNLLNIVLAYTMDTDYLFYYFSPLVSFWFGVIWVTMWFGHELNSDMPFLLTKFAISAVLVTLFTTTPGILEQVFSFLELVARIKWDAAEWRFRTALDAWIVYAGMIVAILFVRVKGSGISSWPQWPRYRAIVITASAFTMPAFFIFAVTRANKFVYNKWHPYISFLPIVAFIVLRNSSQHLRNTHSAAFAFIGRCSLETFILQFHIWMAGDTKGILVAIGPSQWRWPSFLVETTVFIFLCWKIAGVTGTIVDWIVETPKIPTPHIALMPCAIATDENPSEDMIGGRENDDSDDSEQIDSALLPLPASSIRQLSFSEKLVRVAAIHWENDLKVRIGIVFVSLWFLTIVSTLLFTRALLTLDLPLTRMPVAKWVDWANAFTQSRTCW
jgi:N-acetylneuraminate 9-O-acetyltransferase